MTIVDTDILIDVARGEGDAIACLQRLEKTSTLVISVISQMELIVGCRNKKELQGLKTSSPAFKSSKSLMRSLIARLNYWGSIF